MLSRNIVLAMLALTAWVMTSYAGDTGAQGLKLAAAATLENGRIQLSFALENEGDLPVVIRRRDLPWEDPANVIAVVVNKKTGIPLQRSTAIQDYFPTPETVRLSPKKDLRGTLSLDSYGQLSPEQVTGGSFLVAWHYEAKNVEGRALGTFGGWLEVPSAKKK